MSQAMVEQVRAKFPTPLGDQHAAFLVKVARALGKGLVKKPSGTRVRLPDGTEVSQDVVMLPDGQAWDILRDAEGNAEPVYNKIDPIDRERYCAVDVQPEPTLTDPAAKFPAYDVDSRAAFARIEASLARIEAALKPVAPSAAPPAPLPPGAIDVGDLVKVFAGLMALLQRR